MSCSAPRATAADETGKKVAALTALDSQDVTLSVQVLQEFYVQATRTTRSERLEHEQAVDLVESWLRFRVQEMTVPVLRSTFATAARWQISYWDAAIIEAAREAGCPSAAYVTFPISFRTPGASNRATRPTTPPSMPVRAKIVTEGRVSSCAATSPAIRLPNAAAMNHTPII